MKNFITLLFFSFIIYSTVQAQPAINGAWSFSDGQNQHQLFFQNGFFFHTVLHGNEFVMTRGGYFSIKGNIINTSLLFNSADSSKVNQHIAIPFSISANILSLNLPDGNVKFTQVDNGKAPLAGVWKITARMNGDGEIVPIHQTGTRHTYKLLTGTKFQWVAIDPGKKYFSGTGGGAYTFKDGKYTENIEFFSRDNSRVGASLIFKGELKNEQWHHSGLSSNGIKIYEVWSKVFPEIPSK